MSDTTLRDLALACLEKDTKPEDEWSALVLAALEGPDELAQLLLPFSCRITAQGFRGIGPEATLDLTGPEALGWQTPLEAYRPFLSYNELGSLLDEGPSKLCDAKRGSAPDSRSRGRAA